ncbi:MAG: hypothetical protein H6738_16015 [Alphaproteobacteria bacterium]|nr:hypothetical protein [Alphaproteobacteria bacterium]MCB9698285.1 hypothetical protein [Alphaproteobacteria bacterium]
MQRVPKGFVVTLGISAALTVAALFVSLRGTPAHTAEMSAAGMPESCVRYGRVECCYKSE